MRIAISLITIGLSVSTAYPQATEWTSGGAGGQWTDATKWSLGHVPLAGEIVYIADGSTVDFNGTTTPLLSNVYVGAFNLGAGGLVMFDGTLNVDNFYIGAGNLGIVGLAGTGAVQATTSVYIGVNGLNSDGKLQMTGGSITAPVFAVGHSDIGALEMSGGQIDATTATILSNNPGTSTTITLSGGVINTPDFNYANSGATDFTMSDGEINTSNFYGGNNNTGSAVVKIQGGTLTASTFRNSWQGSVSTRQTGGVVDVNELSLALGNGTGFYSLLGGTLDAFIINRGATATYAFNMSGGTLLNRVFGDWNKNMDLAPTGGMILPDGLNPGSMFLRGDLNLGAAAGITFQLPGDKIVMHDTGSVELAGSLTLELNFGPSVSLEFLLIDNDDADPVIGNFAGLPEGATITPTFGGTPYPMQISYVGGDGNDVVLIYNDCPIDFTNDGVLDNGDIGAFIALFIAGDLAADITNDGFLDNGDIMAFITAFLAGC